VPDASKGLDKSTIRETMMGTVLGSLVGSAGFSVSACAVRKDSLHPLRSMVVTEAVLGRGIE